MLLLVVKFGGTIHGAQFEELVGSTRQKNIK